SSIQGYAYIELRPTSAFEWVPNHAKLPDSIIERLAAVRTDLDRFSKIEISALMFHGYTLIDNCLQQYHKADGWVDKFPPLRFSVSAQMSQIDWANLDADRLRSYERHLDASSSPFSVWRTAKRTLALA